MSELELRLHNQCKGCKALITTGCQLGYKIFVTDGIGLAVFKARPAEPCPKPAVHWAYEVAIDKYNKSGKRIITDPAEKLQIGLLKAVEEYNKEIAEELTAEKHDA